LRFCRPVAGTRSHVGGIAFRASARPMSHFRSEMSHVCLIVSSKVPRCPKTPRGFLSRSWRKAPQAKCLRIHACPDVPKKREIRDILGRDIWDMRNLARTSCPRMFHETSISPEGWFCFMAGSAPSGIEKVVRHGAPWGAGDNAVLQMNARSSGIKCLLGDIEKSVIIGHNQSSNPAGELKTRVGISNRSVVFCRSVRVILGVVIYAPLQR